TAAGFLSEVGLSPRLVTDVVVVFRTFPIRVAGNQAGPLKNEISWAQLQRESGYPFPIEELTTVTRKTRRVSRFDWELASAAVQINRPTHLAINGLDYLNFENRGVPDFGLLSSAAKVFVEQLKSSLATNVSFFGTGPRLDQMFSGMNTPSASMQVRIAS